MPDSFTQVQYNSTKEKWIDLDGQNRIFLKIIYGSHRPITDINFYRIKYYKEDPHRMVSRSFLYSVEIRNSLIINLLIYFVVNYPI